MRRAGADMRARSWSRARRGVAAALTAGATILLCFALRPGWESSAYAGTEPAAAESAAEQLDYASPLEILLSPDGTRLYVLCQQSEEVRVLDAATYAVIGTIAVGRVPRGMALSRTGDRLFVTNSWDDTLSVIDTRTLVVAATWNVGAEPSGVVEDPAEQVHLCCQPHLQRCRRARCADGRRREAPASRARRKLSHAFARWQADLRNAYLSQSYGPADGSRKSHAARVGDHGDRCAERGGGRSDSAAIALPASFTWRSPPTAGLAWWPSIIPRTLYRWRIWNTAERSPTRSRCLAPMWASR